MAYRMLGSVSEADDAVQEAWLRLSRSRAGEVENLAGFVLEVTHGGVGWDQLRPWLVARRELPAGPLFCIVDGATRGRPWNRAAVRHEFRRVAGRAAAGGARHAPGRAAEAGHALTRPATGIFARLDGAEQELGEIAGRRHGRLRFGSFPTALATFVPPAFVDFRRRHAEVTLTVVDDHLQRLIPRLEAGELDLALIYDHEALPEIAARDLERIPLLDDAFRAILPAGHRLARRRRPLELSDLAGEPWVGGAPTSAWFRVTSHACRLAGFAPQVGFASDDYIALQALVAAGLGVSVIPGPAVAHPLPGSRCER